MSREEGMFMFRQEGIDKHGDGCTEMTDIVSIIIMFRNITDQESSLTEVVLQDLIMVSIMEMVEHKESLTEAPCVIKLVHSTELVP